MCVIIHKPAGKEIAEKDILTAARKNSDGFGFMYYDPNQKKIITGKALFKDPKELLEIFKQQIPYEACYHLRIKTHGSVSIDNCHPFKVLSQDKNGRDMYFMHNGIIAKVKEEKDESDTRAFNRLILRPLLKKRHSLIKTDSFKTLVESFIGGSKLVFMYGDGEVIKFNEQLGGTHDGMWVSNTHSFVSYSSYESDSFQSGCSWKQSQRKDADTEFGKSTALLFGETLRSGMDINIVSDLDNTYFDTGTIKSIYPAAIHVTLKDALGVQRPVIFDKQGIGFTPNQEYSLIPLVSDIESFGMYQTKELKDRVENQATEVPQIEHLSKKNEDDNTFRISHEVITIPKLEFDSKDDRHGGAWLPNSLVDYDGVSIIDVNNMDPQQRLNFFLEHPQKAFAMFQDLVEYLVIVDQENETIDAYQNAFQGVS